MRTRAIEAAALLATLCLAAPAAALDSPHGDSLQCETCHTPHQASYPNLLGQLCSYCHYDGGPATNAITHSSLTTSAKYGDWDIDCWGCHDPHTQWQDKTYGTTYGKYLYTALSAPIKKIDPTAPGPYYPALSILRTATSSDLKHTSNTDFVDSDASTSDDVCQVCHQATKFYATGAKAGYHKAMGASSQPGGTCTTCHPHTDGFKPKVGACDQCHGAPPATGVHAIHAAGADIPTAYGSLDARGNATSYAFNCGYCHPLDPAKHRNGTLEVELYNNDPAKVPLPPTNPNDPADRRMLKGASPLATYTAGPNTFTGEAADYTDGTCSNVYCHSAEKFTAATVPQPTTNWPTFSWAAVTPFYDVTQNQCCNGTTDNYPDFNLTVTRNYASPKWQGETHAGAEKCAHCHAYPPTVAPPDNLGVGQGHEWIGRTGGWGEGHFFNMGAMWPIQCRRCHVQTVADYLPEELACKNTGGASCYASTNANYYYDDYDRIIFNKAMTIGGFGVHVNGKKDVAFDYSTTSCSASTPDLDYFGSGVAPCLTTATTYNAGTRSCSNVPCHLEQTQVTWGAPYGGDWGDQECDTCHHYGW